MSPSPTRTARVRCCAAASQSTHNEQLAAAGDGVSGPIRSLTGSPQQGGRLMPTARVNGVELYYEETGEGYPLVFSHEFAGDYRSWENQVRFFSRRYRVITWNYCGYPPSEVPSDPAAYSEEQL